ncbi:MAG: tRNA(Ile)-lysidine synthetase, partial [Planctomycetes bacterium]|nr:tRNA(Ile)-lysidine synthetase [Planctomycetota bacterium]
MSNFPLEKAVDRFIAENNLFDASSKILLAVSGGADSMALMAMLSRLRAAGAIDVELSVAHINHLLRGSDSDADEAFVIAWAAKFNLPVKTRRVD